MVVRGMSGFLSVLGSGTIIPATLFYYRILSLFSPCAQLF